MKHVTLEAKIRWSPTRPRLRHPVDNYVITFKRQTLFLSQWGYDDLHWPKANYHHEGSRMTREAIQVDCQYFCWK